MAFAVGIDVGSTTTKAVLISGDGVVACRALVSSGADFGAAAKAVLDEVLAVQGLSEAPNVVSTGYGRTNVASAKEARTEISCHARGVHHLLSGPLTVVDIGGQDNKVIRIGVNGEILDFSMNRKCAAGTGAFLEETARRMGVAIDAMNGLATTAEEEVVVGSFCTVFASTEMLRLIREGKSVASIVRGAFRAVARRVIEMGTFAGIVVLSGGVAAHNPVLADILATETGCDVKICPQAQYAGALGAALYAADLV